MCMPCTGECTDFHIDAAVTPAALHQVTIELSRISPQGIPTKYLTPHGSTTLGLLNAVLEGTRMLLPGMPWHFCRDAASIGLAFNWE